MLLTNSAPGPNDETAQVVRAAQEGCPDAFSLLFQLCYPGMLAVATQILGPGPEAEDACQDATIQALRRIGDLRDPAAVRAWLNMIVRNNCRTLLRARLPIPVGVAGADLPAPDLDDPVACVERDETRDWIWHGLRLLTPATQPVAMLRYFTENNSYSQIAALCGIPVGTVRSRLSEARRQLAVILPSIHDKRHDDTAAMIAERHAEATGILTAVSDGAGMARFGDRWAPDLTMWWPSGRRTVGARPLLDDMRGDHDDGVTYRLTGLLAGDGVTIWEQEYVNPPENPDHCPPAGTWLLREKHGLVTEIRLMHTPRKPSASPTR